MFLIELIGDTPLLELATSASKPRVRLFGKVEGNNPGGSVKDRPARSMIERAEARGDLKPGVRLVEPTSGNTGIALAFTAASRGYKLILTMPESMSIERRRVMAVLGAELVLTEAAKGMPGCDRESQGNH